MCCMYCVYGGVSMRVCCMRVCQSVCVVCIVSMYCVYGGVLYEGVSVSVCCMYCVYVLCL